jgi:hypothetical protein
MVVFFGKAGKGHISERSNFTFIKIFPGIWAHFRRFTPETGLSGAPRVRL